MKLATNRRTFLIVAGTAAAGASMGVKAQTKLDPADAQAAALGYVDDAAKADVKRFPQYKAGQACIACALYQGKPADTTGPCAIFPGKLVNAKGWCSAWSKKAA